VFFFGNGYSSTKVTDGILRSIWLKSASQMYVVRDGGRAFRRLGTSPWAQLGTGTNQDLRSVHGAGAVTLVVGGGGTILKLK
jgi:carbamate kinase